MVNLYSEKVLGTTNVKICKPVAGGLVYVREISMPAPGLNFGGDSN
jgi:hypothetical protein